VKEELLWGKMILVGFCSNSMLYCSHVRADYIVEQEQRQVTRV
jgi:hypothetical protein